MESADKKTPPRRASTRPTLLDSARDRAADSGPETRMLACLEPGDQIPMRVSSRKGVFRRKAIATWLVALLVGAGAFFAYDGKAPAGVSAGVVPATPSPVAITLRPAPSIDVADAASAAARIEPATLPEPIAAPPAAAPPSSGPPRVDPATTVRRKMPAKPAAPHVVAKAGTAAKPRRTDGDADAELVAAIIARLDRRGAQPVDAARGARREGH